MHLIVWTISALALLHSSQAATTFKFSSSRVWVGGNTKAVCTPDAATITAGVQTISINSLKDNLVLTSTKTNCNPGTQFGPVTATTGATTATLTLDTAAAPDYTINMNNLAISDASSYTCTLTQCSSGTPVTSTPALPLVVVSLPTGATIAQTENPFLVYENTLTEKTVSCSGNPGVDGKIVITVNNTNVVSQDVTSSVGGATIPEQTRTYAFRLNRTSETSIVCEAVNAAPNVLTSRAVRLVSVQYPPNGNVFTSNKMVEYPITATTTAGQYVINAKAPLDLLVTCTPVSNPPSNGITFTSLSGSAGTVQVVTANKELRVQFSNTQQGSVTLQCNATYGPSIQNSVASIFTSTLTINVTSGASLAKFSVAAYLATLLVLLKALQ